MKILKWILLIVDALAFAGLVAIRIWWEKTHKKPGLSEILNLREVNMWIIVTGVILVILIIIFVLTKVRK